MTLIWTICILLTSVLCMIENVSPEIYTSLVQLEELILAEERMADNIQEFIKKEEFRIENLKEVVRHLAQHHSESLKDVEKALASPLDQFRLIKNLNTNRTRTTLSAKSFIEFTEKFATTLKAFPAAPEIEGAASALLRLQETYNITTDDMALSRLPGIDIPQPLDSESTFLIAQVAYNQTDHFNSVRWFNHTLNRQKAEGASDAKLASTLDYLAFSCYKQNNIKDALQFTEEWLKLDPTNRRARNNRNNYRRDLPSKPPQPYKKEVTGFRASKAFQQYQQLCRGEKIIPNPYANQVYCRYKRDHPYYYIRPLKEEIMYYEPFVAVYHDVLVDYEMEMMKKLATPKLARSGLFNNEKGSEVRVSKTAWLRDDENPIVAKLSFKTEASTGLSIKSADMFQILNYGIGGHYEPHHDYSYNNGKGGWAFETHGNRISTSLYYLSDVSAGGATVFPYLGLTVFPEKGSMLFWYNLFDSGEPNPNTYHAGCPVLTGTKWACNKWIHELNQAFRRPCTKEVKPAAFKNTF